MQLCCMPRGFFSSDVSGVVFCNNSLFQPTFGRCRWIMTDVFSLAAFWVSLSSNLLWSKWLPDETMAPVQRHDLPSYHLRTEVVEILRFDDVMAALEKKKIHARKIINSWLQLKNQPLFQTSKLTSFFYLKKNAAPISPNHPEIPNASLIWSKICPEALRVQPCHRCSALGFLNCKVLSTPLFLGVIPTSYMVKSQNPTVWVR